MLASICLKDWARSVEISISWAECLIRWCDVADFSLGEARPKDPGAGRHAERASVVSHGLFWHRPGTRGSAASRIGLHPMCSLDFADYLSERNGMILSDRAARS